MKIRTNQYLITAILVTSNFLRLCEGDNNIDHESLENDLHHLDHSDDLHDINNFDDNNDVHRVELVPIPLIQQSNVPTTITKVVEQTVIKQSNNDENNSPKTDLSMKDIYSNNKLKENGNGNVESIGLSSIPSKQASDLQGNIKNIIHTTVTKTTTSGSPSNELNESFDRVLNLNLLPSNNIISKMSSANSNYNDGITGSSSSKSNSMDENIKTKTISTISDIIDGNGFNKSKRISRTPGGSFRRTKTTIIKKQNINDSNDRSNLGKSTSTVDKDNNVFNKGTSSRRQQTSFNKFNSLGNLLPETGALQNPGSFVQTKTTIIKNERAADEIKLDDLNDKKINYNIDDGMSTSNNIVNTNYITSSDINGNDKGGGYSYGYGFGNGMDSGYFNKNGNYNNIFNDNILSSNHLMGGDSSGDYSSYIISNRYSKGNGKGNKRKKNGSVKKYRGGRSKNISYGKSKGNGQIRVKIGRNYGNLRSSKNRSGGNSQYYSSTNYIRGGQSKSFSSSASSSDESSMKKKKSCHCNERKLNKRDSSEINGSSQSKEHHRPGSHDLGQSDITNVLNRQGETGSQLIKDHQLPNIDKSNQYQIPNTDSLYKSDSQQEQYLGSPGLGLGSGHDSGRHPGNNPGRHPWHGPGLSPQVNLSYSRPFIGDEYPKDSAQNLQPPPLSQSPYPYSFNKDYYSDFSKMGLTTPRFMDIQSGQENQININTDLPQMQQDIEGPEFNRMDALNLGSMTTRTSSNMIRNTDDGPIIQYFKLIKTTRNIDGNGTPEMRIVQTQSVPSED